MLEQKELKLLRLNVNKTKMVKLCRSYFPLLKNKKFAVVMSFTYLFVLVK